eukprot:7379984-Prymnesium_polylepis.2
MQPQQPYMLNPEFDLTNELANISFNVQHPQRIGLQLAKYREGRTPAIFENKLLANSLLRKLGIPVAEILYGAFGNTSMGGWPMYSRKEFVKTVADMEPKAFILKSATDGMSTNMIIMSPK